MNISHDLIDPPEAGGSLLLSPSITALPFRITAAAAGLVIAMIATVAAPALGDRYGEQLAIEEMTPVLIEQPVPPKTGLGIVLLKMVQGW